MWLILLAISVTIVTGDVVVETDCSTPIHEVCKADELPRSIPVTEAELDVLCSKLIVYIDCGNSMERKCQHLSEVIEVAEQIQETVKLVCDKNKQIYKDVLGNLECFKKFIENQMGASCFLSESDEERIQTHEEALVKQGLVKSGELDKRCLSSIHEISCLALKLEKECGEVAMNTYIDIALHTTKVFGECEDDVKKVLKAVIVLHKLEAMEAKLKENQDQEDLHDLIRNLEAEEPEGEGTK